MTDEVLADLQAQVIALRVAVEAAWLSLLSPAPDPVADAQRLGAEHITAIGQLDGSDAGARAARDAIAHHTEQLWGSIAWQLEEARKKRTDA